MNLKEGKNSLSFSVTSSFAGKATCTAHMFYWKWDVPVVISDIDGTITKYSSTRHGNSALHCVERGIEGIVLMVGRMWWDIYTP